MEENTQEKQKVMLIPKCVSVEEMFNIINDKLDFLLSKTEEKK